jgi:hypothetical protein
MAEAVLEEMGHAYMFATGSGGSSVIYDGAGGGYFVGPNGKPMDPGLYNQQLIMQNCNK